MNKKLRKIPSVSDILKKLDNLNKFDDKYLSFLAKKEISKIRKKVIKANLDFNKDQIIFDVVSKVSKSISCSSKYTINGTGVVLHTGLGRAPIGSKILKKVFNQLSTYSGHKNMKFWLCQQILTYLHTWTTVPYNDCVGVPISHLLIVV